VSCNWWRINSRTPRTPSIAQAIVLAHDGELSLLDRNPHGLLVRVVLPTPALRGVIAAFQAASASVSLSSK
jgi:hypothetical protein